MNDLKHISLPFLTCVALALFSTFAGCEQKEKVLDIETPNGSIEVERSKGDGKVDIQINKE
jgi:hypothetical protein